MFICWRPPPLWGRVVAMEDIYEKATWGYEVTEATASRIRGLIRDVRGLEIHLSGLGVFVEALPQPPYGVRKVLGRFNTMLEAQNFAWAWLTGPYGVVRDICFTRVAPGICGVDMNVLVRDIRTYLAEKSKVLRVEVFPSCLEAEDYLVSRVRDLTGCLVSRKNVAHLVYPIGGGKGQALYTDNLIRLIAELNWITRPEGPGGRITEKVGH